MSLWPCLPGAGLGFLCCCPQWGREGTVCGHRLMSQIYVLLKVLLCPLQSSLDQQLKIGPGNSECGTVATYYIELSEFILCVCVCVCVCVCACAYTCTCVLVGQKELNISTFEIGVEIGGSLSVRSTCCCIKGFPGSSYDKQSTCNAGDPGSIPGSGRSSGEGNGNSFQYSCLENPMEVL